MGYMTGDFRTFALDCGTRLFEAFFNAEGPYDYVLNLSALKHVRSEKDPYTLMRMVEVNILNTLKTQEMAIQSGATKYFCVSTDKAANPVNMMGASKRIMEMFLMNRAGHISTSTARFANVAFSDGSLLHGFNQRLLKQQPLAAPRDVRRYFLTSKEAGELCLMATLLGENRDVFFPKLKPEVNMLTFAAIAEKYLLSRGFEPYLCDTEKDARQKVKQLSVHGRWPCYFFDSDTTGEKPYEEFFSDEEVVDLQRFASLGVVKTTPVCEGGQLMDFVESMTRLVERGTWGKEEIVGLFRKLLPDFAHMETGKYLDDRM